jgi:hypothetical protein
VGPFFADAGRRLMSPVFMEDLRLIEEPRGKSLQPPASDKVLAAGTRVRIDRIEFPTVLIAERRPRGTPRFNSWVYLEAEGDPADRPIVLPLPMALRSYDEVVAEMERYFSVESLDTVLESFPESIRRAIAEKRVVEKMDPIAATMAWGYPEKRTIVINDTGRDETWTYASGARRILFTAGRVTKIEP